MSKVKFYKALKHDYALLGSILFAAISLGFSVYSYLNDENTVLLVFGILFIVMTLLGLLRFITLSRYSKMSFEVEGVVSDIWFMKDRGRITFVYTLYNVKYKRGLAIMKTKETRNLVVGSKVSLLVKTNSPEKAIIKDLYC